jgi:hypothetical protein
MPDQPNETPAPGKLRNGNPRGNPNLAPRCGARTRAGTPCGAPAIQGKLRCRLHGGKSTGPRTAAGKARLRAARTSHGGYGADARDQHRRLAAFIAETEEMLRLFAQGDIAGGLRLAGIGRDDNGTEEPHVT